MLHVEYPIDYTFRPMQLTEDKCRMDNLEDSTGSMFDECVQIGTYGSIQISC